MANKLDSQIGERVRTYRKLAQLTQDQLSAKAELSVHYLSRIETGMGTASLDSLNRIAQALGVQIGELFQFHQGQPHEAKELIQQITRLLKRQRPEALRMIRNLIGQIVELLPRKEIPSTSS